MGVEFRVLGPLEVQLNGVLVPLPSGRGRVLLAALLLRANHVVRTDELVDVLWDGEPPNPDRAKSTLQMVVTRLRQALGDANCVRTSTEGYSAVIDPDALDLHRFRSLVSAERFAEALGLWRGSPLSNVASDSLHRDEVPALLDEHVAVLERRVDADLERGADRELVAELRVLTRQHPLRESFWRQLMLALYRSDQQAEALAAYRAVSELLAEELGVDPGTKLKDLHQQILEGDVKGPAPGRTPVPRQLPAHTSQFVGRVDELEQLAALLGVRPHSPTVVISAIRGSGGIGKTALAVHWAHQVADQFPDGQLYVNLRGFDPVSEPTAASEVLRGFLDALGIPPARVPASTDAQAALYRSELADRKVLVVLDNARDTDQVRPLLPGTPSCLVVITSRNQLTGLVAREGAHAVGLNLLTADEAWALLSRVLGVERVEREPDAVSGLIDRCAGLPLALSVVAARAVVDPAVPLARLAAELADENARLDAFDIGDTTTNIRSVFAWSYERLSPAAARMFRLLGLHPGADFSAFTAARLADVPPHEGRGILNELTQLHLVGQPLPGRFAFHDLMNDFARELAHSTDSPVDRELALHRLLDFYLQTSTNAANVIATYNGGFEPEGLSTPDRPFFVDRAQAHEWCIGELSNLVAAARATWDDGAYRFARKIPIVLWNFLYLRKLVAVAVELMEIAIRSARVSGDRKAEAHALQGLALAYNEGEQVEDAIRTGAAALELRAELGDRRGQAASLNSLGAFATKLGQYPLALEYRLAALQICVEEEHHQYRALTLNGLANTYMEMGENARAVDMCRSALELIASDGNLLFEGWFLDTLGQAFARMGDHDNAVATFERAVDTARNAADPTGEGVTLDNLASLLAAAGEVDRAAELWTRALALFDGIDHPDAEVVRIKLGALSLIGQRG